MQFFFCVPNEKSEREATHNSKQFVYSKYPRSQVVGFDAIIIYSKITVFANMHVAASCALART